MTVTMLNRKVSFEYDLDPENREEIIVYDQNGMGTRMSWDHAMRMIFSAIEQETKHYIESNFKLRISFEKE